MLCPARRKRRRRPFRRLWAAHQGLEVVLIRSFLQLVGRKISGGRASQCECWLLSTCARARSAQRSRVGCMHERCHVTWREATVLATMVRNNGSSHFQVVDAMWSYYETWYTNVTKRKSLPRIAAATVNPAHLAQTSKACGALDADGAQTSKATSSATHPLRQHRRQRHRPSFPQTLTDC